MNPLIQSKNTTLLPLLIALTLGFFGLSPQAHAVCQEGCLTNNNTALGDDALISNMTGFNNTAMGFVALSSNTTGDANTATGSAALSNNTDGFQNTATGSFALQFNTTGWNNTATGYQTLLNNTTGDDNTANGAFALFRNTGGFKNTADGDVAFFDNTTGSNNTASGFNALGANTSGSNNIAVGVTAGINLITGSNNIYIGNIGAGAGESARIRIGTQGTQTATFIAGISGVAVTGSQVVVNSHGKLGITASSARFKEEIQSMDNASEAIYALKPVTFRYKKDFDPDCIPQFGLVAEEVAKINPDLVARDEQGKPYSVRYEAINAMLLNEFLKEHRKVEEQEATIAQLKATSARQEAVNAEQRKRMEALAARLNEQAAQIQEVSAQLSAGRVRVVAATGVEASKFSKQILTDNQ
jgi:hypothetical protein